MNYVNVENVIDDIQYDSHSFFTWIKTSNPTSNERIYAINDRYGGNRFLFGVRNGKVDLYVPVIIIQETRWLTMMNGIMWAIRGM